VHRGKSTTQFVRRPFVAQVKAELVTYKTFRRLTEEWVDLALQAAKLKLQAAKEAAKTAPE
jgi:ribosome maturation protein Sdo1